MLDTSVIVAGFTPEIIADFESYASSMICRAELARGLAVFAEDPVRKSRALIRRELGGWIPWARRWGTSATTRPSSSNRWRRSSDAENLRAACNQTVT